MVTTADYKKICQKYVKGKTIQGFASAVGFQSYEKSKGMHRANHWVEETSSLLNLKF